MLNTLLSQIEPTDYFWAIGYAIVLLFIAWKQGWIIFVPHKAITMGKVTSVDWDGPIISYAVDGRTYSIKYKKNREADLYKEDVKDYVAQMQKKSTPIGAEYKVAYDSTNPQKAKLCPEPYKRNLFIKFLVFGIIVILL